MANGHCQDHPHQLLNEVLIGGDALGPLDDSGHDGTHGNNIGLFFRSRFVSRGP
jgi:hypothetical protein